MKKNRIYLGIVAFIFAFGVYQALRRGGEDFLVFYHAGRLTLDGLGQEIYTNSPDRFLYAPGFAWFIAPFALIPWAISFPLWCLMKALSFGVMVKVLTRRFSALSVLLGILFFARPLLNELRYGQVNLLIVTLSVWALDSLFVNDKKAPKKFWAWFTFSIAAVAKLFPAVLIWIPFFPYRHGRADRLSARLGIFCGIFTLVFIPILTQGLDGLVLMYQGWQQALLSKGFPVETHNQSFLAFLFHSFSGETFYSLMRGPVLHDYTWISVPKSLLYSLGMVWSVSTGLLLLVGTYFCGIKKDFRLGLILLAASVLPSHLVWKPYFVFAIPLAIYVAFICETRKKGMPYFILGALLINLSSFDFIGREWASILEAHAHYLWITLVLLVVGLKAKRPTALIAY